MTELLNNNIYICFPGGRHKALTMSFDDGKVEDRRLVALFDRYGIRSTFNLNSGLHAPPRIPMEEYPALYRNHEIACHTATHPTIARSPLGQVAAQVMSDRAELEKLAGYPVRGLAYPNGSLSREIRALLPALGIRYGRTVNATGSFAMPEDYLAWDPTCHFRDAGPLAEEFVALFKRQYLYLFYIWGHSYELAQESDWEKMEALCALLAGREDTWYATNIEIVDYMEAASRLRFTMAGDLVVNPNAQTLWLDVNNGTVVELPGGAAVKLP